MGACLTRQRRPICVSNLRWEQWQPWDGKRDGRAPRLEPALQASVPHWSSNPGLRWAVKKLGLTPCFDSAVLFPPLAANPEVACYGMIPSPTRHVPAPIHPRLFAVGDSHRSQGFLYPWKPYAPPHIPVYSRFVPPPQAAEQTGKRPNRSEHPRCLCRRRRQRHRGNGIWRGHEAWGKETPGYGADRLRRKRAGGGA